MSKRIVLIILGILVCLIVIGIVAIKMIYKEPKVAVLCYHNVATEEEIANNIEEKIWTINKHQVVTLLYIRRAHFWELEIE